MNDAIQRELKIVVERAVRPVPATIARKRKMREELLAHLVSIFEEELGRLGDEQAALDQAKQRFGDPKELTSQLQESVSRWEGFHIFLEKRSRYEPGQPVLRLVRLHVLLALAGYAMVILLALIPVSMMRGRQSELGAIMEILFVVAAVIALLSFVSVLLVDRMALALCRECSKPAMRRIALYSLLSLPILPLSTLLLYWGLGLGLAATWHAVRLACGMALLIPVLVMTIARLLAEEQRYIEDWASLEIGE